MSENTRHDSIITLLRKLRKVSVQDLTRRFNVSKVTIRKDLTFLEEQGLLMRTHGGAVLADSSYRDNYFLHRKTIYVEEKKRIAQKAADLVLEDDTVYIDSGSTATYLAEKIKHKTVRVITNNLDAVNILSDSEDIVLISVGGNYRKEAGSFIGPLAEDVIRHFNIDIAFLGTSGISMEGNFSSYNIFESRLKNTVIQASKRKVILSDSSKYGKEAFAVFAEADDIEVLITDMNFKEYESFVDMGVEVLRVSCPPEFQFKR